ncbi:MAG: beta-lactamase family protein [Cognatishimia sp.]|uniref:serine hydrolase domain-containing protein n=1 Tax=Cognatishimia sp. TaxID=2211648 RepID=UPI003B8C7518
MIDTVFNKLAGRTPKLATGLAYSQHGLSPELRVQGPLWNGSKQRVPVDANWHIGSITKTFTATMAMQLVERGALDLDAPISEYLVDRKTVHPEVRATTMRRLLSHSSGIAANPSMNELSLWRDQAPDVGRFNILKPYMANALPHERGQHLYSNLGYMLAGHILEQITGSPWEAQVVSEIAKPLGLKSLGFGAPEGDRDPRGHRRTLFRSTSVDPKTGTSDNPPWLGPAGTLHLSLPDLVTYGQAHLKAANEGRLGFLSKPSSALMRTEVASNYGLGWVRQGDVFWHNGSNSMWYALLTIDPKSNHVVALVQNSYQHSRRIDNAAREILEQLQRAS